jgi:hypothetical protein
MDFFSRIVLEAFFKGRLSMKLALEPDHGVTRCPSM